MRSDFDIHHHDRCRQDPAFAAELPCDRLMRKLRFVDDPDASRGVHSPAISRETVTAHEPPELRHQRIMIARDEHLVGEAAR